MNSVDPAPIRPARGRPRDAGVDDRVLRAVVQELAESGVAGFSVNSVAARAKVAKRSIYTRWPERDALIAAGMATLAAGLSPPHTGRLESDLAALFDRISGVLAEPRRTILARCAVELHDYPDLYAIFKRDSIDRCLAAIEDALFDATARGELRRDVDRSLVAEMFVNTILGPTSAADRSEPAASAARTRLVDVILHGIAVAGA
jgi:AcrR family transcriptional regulator